VALGLNAAHLAQVGTEMEAQALNLNQVLLSAMDRHASQTCLQVKREGRYQPVSYAQFRTLTLRLADYFRHEGITQVAIAADNCLEWLAVYVGCLLSGGVVIPLRTSLAPNTLRFILEDSGAQLILLADASDAKRILASTTARARQDLPDLKVILLIDNSITAAQAQDLSPNVTPLATALAQTSAPTPESATALRQHAVGVPPEAAASILYHMNPIVAPKGAVLDHMQACAAMRHIAEWFPFEEDDLAFTAASWSELPGLWITLHCFLSGKPNIVAAGDAEVDEDLLQTSPTVMLATPFWFERTYDRIMDEMADLPESSREVFRWAVARGKEYRAAGPDASLELRQHYAGAAMTFFWRMWGRIGGRLRRIYSAGASLPRDVTEFFEAIGLPALNIYSLTGAGGFPAASLPHSRRPGSCGRIAPGFEVRLDEDGEVLVRGETVLRKCWRRPDETQQGLDADGWLHSGDIGHFDQDGYLYISGRKQHTLVLSTGQKIAPLTLENALIANPFITQAIVFGEGKPYITALIFPDAQAVTASLHLEGQDVDTVTSMRHAKCQAVLKQAVDEINSRLDEWAQIKQYHIIEPSPDGDFFTVEPIERHRIAERYAAQIEAMYPASVQLAETEVTDVQIDPERLRELLEKESILDAWLADAGIGFLFELARDKQIDAPSMVHIADAAATIAQMEHEEKPLSTALIVGDPMRIGSVLPASQIQLVRHDHIRRMRRLLVTMATMVDGLVLGYAVDKYGYVRGVHRLEGVLEEPGQMLLGPQFRRHAAISRQCDAVVFFVPSGGRHVRVFANGQLAGRYANGDWSPDNMSHVDEIIMKLVDEKDYDRELVQRVLRCAFQMSEENLGAIYLLGDADAVLERSDASKIGSFVTFINTDVDKLSDRELINFAKQDGATMIDVHGRFMGCMVLLRPGAATPAEIGPGKGARHSSAAKMSAEADCLAVTVSQDGPVTVYASGKQILSL
jgi:long-chain acyl-CoA synthetase